jgi:hypothetical protein
MEEKSQPRMSNDVQRIVSTYHPKKSPYGLLLSGSLDEKLDELIQSPKHVRALSELLGHSSFVLGRNIYGVRSGNVPQVHI